MDNVCLCGAKWKADTHEDQCALCRRAEDALYANVPPNPHEPMRPRHRRAMRDVVLPRVQAVPESSRHRVTDRGQVMTCRCGHEGQRFFGTGLVSRQTVCQDCYRREEREYLLARHAKEQTRTA